MKHQCKTMKKALSGIKKFNNAVEKGTDDTVHLSMRIYDDPSKESRGMIFDWLFYQTTGEELKDRKIFYQGQGFRFLCCPFCGEKIDAK